MNTRENPLSWDNERQKTKVTRKNCSGSNFSGMRDTKRDPTSSPWLCYFSFCRNRSRWREREPMRSSVLMESSCRCHKKVPNHWIESTVRLEMEEDSRHSSQKAIEIIQKKRKEDFTNLVITICIRRWWIASDDNSSSRENVTGNNKRDASRLLTLPPNFIPPSRFRGNC